MPLATATERAKSVDVEVDVDERDPLAERELRNGETMTVGELFKEWHTRHAVPNLGPPPLAWHLLLRRQSRIEFST